MEKEMNIKFLAAAALAVLPFGARAQSVTYALPRTSVSLDVEAVKESFFAGPYARYSQKYLGVEARIQDETTYTLSSIKVTPYVEADQSTRYALTLPKGKGAAELGQLTAQGLVAVSDGNFGEEGVWRFTGKGEGDFASKGVSSNLTSESATLYQNVRQETAYSTVAIRQDMVVEKSSEAKAAEAAEMIFKLRKVRVQIVTGDTDASYSGEAMSAALEELARLEKEYMTLFVGYSEFQTQRQRFDIVPGRDENVIVAFRLSDSEGLLSADNMGGKPYIMQIDAQPVDAPATGAVKGSFIRYRIPAICTVRISDGVNVLLQSRMPIYQYGIDQTYPVN